MFRFVIIDVDGHSSTMWVFGSMEFSYPYIDYDKKVMVREQMPWNKPTKPSHLLDLDYAKILDTEANCLSRLYDINSQVDVGKITGRLYKIWYPTEEEIKSLADSSPINKLNILLGKAQRLSNLQV
jgi:hypothetical protein